MVVLSSPSYGSFANDVCRGSGLVRGAVAVETFPDGECYQRVLQPVAGEDVVIVGGTISDSETLRIYDLAVGVVEQGARSLCLMLPYSGCSTMDRASRPGDVVTARTRALLVSRIPRPPLGLTIMCLDLHTPALPYYFDPAAAVVHVSAQPVIAEAARQLGGSDFVLASTDLGGAKAVQSLALRLGVQAGIAVKRRLGPTRTEVTAVAAGVRGKRVVIYDDMIRSGASMVSAVRVYHEAGAAGVCAIATHGVLPGDAYAELVRTGLFEQILCTDSHPRTRDLEGQGLRVESVAPLLRDAIRPPGGRTEGAARMIAQGPTELVPFP